MSARKTPTLQTIAALCSLAILLVLPTGLAGTMPLADRAHDQSEPTPPGGERITYVNPPGIGRIAVRLRLPAVPRYPEGAPIVVHTSTFFTPGQGFGGLGATRIGAIEVSYLWPGATDSHTGVSSEGVYDHGGPDSIAAFRDVLRFVSGQIPNYEGHYIAELLDVTPLTDNVGLYAFSHPGIAATNVMAHYGASLPNVKYLVGEENPTTDTLSCVEIGHWGRARRAYLQSVLHLPRRLLALWTRR